MPRFYANENVPAILVRRMRLAGIDTRWASEDSPSEPDEVVLATAVREQRVLLTFDLDFGQLAFQAGLPASCGIVLLRIPQLSAESAAIFALSVLQSRSDWQGQFSVVEPGRVRMKPLPQPPVA